jgi:hypothetical protein
MKPLLSEPVERIAPRSTMLRLLDIKSATEPVVQVSADNSPRVRFDDYGRAYYPRVAA